MKTFKITCVDCRKTIDCPLKRNEKVFANINRGFIARCYDCESKKWWKEERGGKHKDLSIAQIFGKELKNKTINFV